ncbi:MAG: stimulus-sensing domain-containing protein [Maricaulaceae bacterium]
MKKAERSGRAADKNRRRRRRVDGRRRFRSIVFSRLTRLILLTNLIGLAILSAGALALTEWSRALIDARRDSLRTQGELIAEFLSEGATANTPDPILDPDLTRIIMRNLYVPQNQRVRLFAENGEVVTDSYLLGGQIIARPLPPIDPAQLSPDLVPDFENRDFDADEQEEVAGPRTLQQEFSRALLGRVVENERVNEIGESVVSVSIPVRRVQRVVGVLTIETDGVDDIIADQRRALAPFFLVALGVTIVTSLLITAFVARPIRRLSIAADVVREQGPRHAEIPDLSSRRDEIGDLSVTLNAMTHAIAERIDTIEAFAADVAHEVKNPLTSIRSALETLPQVTDPERRDRLLEVLRHDVQRIDRLITDISNASRMDAELSRAAVEQLDLNEVLKEMVNLYADIRRDGEAEVVFSDGRGKMLVEGVESSLTQVFSNLIDNAKTFSPAGGAVRVTASLLTSGSQAPGVRVTVEDEGPGVPEEDKEKIFSRFYTERPKGAAFGSHSGLGLAIARQIVAAHGGAIWVENRRDEADEVAGARFVVDLPRRRR